MGNINDLGFPFTSIAGDRQYSAQDWREYFDALTAGGVVGDIENELEVKPQASPNKTVYIDTGAILIKGAIRVLTSTASLTIADNTSGNPRIDRIVARLNNTDRKIEFAVKQGTPAGSPSAPALTRNTSVWELSLAQIALANGFSTITASEITDERANEIYCGYFKYRAKPAWYPEGGTPPLDAWMYAFFKGQLTSGEIADIEANSSLMAIINDAASQAFVDQLFGVRAVLEKKNVGDKVCTNNEVLSGVYYCSSFSVPAGYTVTTAQNTLCLIVCDGTADIQGTIDASGQGANGGAAGHANAGAGGKGGGNFYLIANQITGTGTIKANGVAGANATAAPATSAAGQTGSNGNIPFGRKAYGGGSFYNTTDNLGQNGLTDFTWTSVMADIGLKDLLVSNITGGGGGGGGASDQSTSNGAPYGGGGGGGVGGSGGAATGNGTSSDTSSGGGGGGGGGLIVLYSRTTISALTLQATGGNGGTGYAGTLAAQGSGGGGGAIICFGKTISASTAVTAGTGKTNGTAGVAISKLL